MKSAGDASAVDGRAAAAAPPPDTRTRFLQAIAEQVPLTRVSEVQLLSLIHI